MKKLLTLLMACMLAFSFAACTKDKDKTSDGDSLNSATTSESASSDKGDDDTSESTGGDDVDSDTLFDNGDNLYDYEDLLGR